MTFPDLPGCITQGDSFEHAFKMAQEALECHLLGMHEDGDEIPQPSGYAAAVEKSVLNAKEDGVELPEGTLFQSIPAPDVAQSPVRINVSIAPHVLERIDRVAKESGVTRSGFLVNAARHYINALLALEAKDGGQPHAN